MLTFSATRSKGNGADAVTAIVADLRWSVRDHAAERLAQNGYEQAATWVRAANGDVLAEAVEDARLAVIADTPRDKPWPSLATVLAHAHYAATLAEQAMDPDVSVGDLDQMVPHLVWAAMEQRQELRQLLGRVESPELIPGWQPVPTAA